MNTWKHILAFLLLAVLTWGVIFVPQALSGQMEDNFLNTTDYRQYSAGSRPKLTSEQVARLYYNREFGSDFQFSPVVGDTNGTDEIRKTVVELVELLFGGDETAHRTVMELLTGDSTVGYSRSSTLVKIGNQPTALNFVTCCVGGKEGNYFEIFYEEKTKTVIRFLFYPLELVSENPDESILYAETLTAALESYFENRLNFGKGEYFLSELIPEVEYVGDKKWRVRLGIVCELLQFNEKGFESEGVYYN